MRRSLLRSWLAPAMHHIQIYHIHTEYHIIFSWMRICHFIISAYILHCFVKTLLSINAFLDISEHMSDLEDVDRGGLQAFHLHLRLLGLYNSVAGVLLL